MLVGSWFCLVYHLLTALHAGYIVAGGIMQTDEAGFYHVGWAEGRVGEGGGGQEGRSAEKGEGGREGGRDTAYMLP